MAQRIAASGFRGYPQAENVAGGQRSAAEVIYAWMCSQGHRATLTNCALDSVGTASVPSTTGRYYYAQDFGCAATGGCRC